MINAQQIKAIDKIILGCLAIENTYKGPPGVFVFIKPPLFEATGPDPVSALSNDPLESDC